MADSADRAADLQAAEIAGALARHGASLVATRTTLNCRDCGEALAPARRALGATRCVECQADRELEARHYARG